MAHPAASTSSAVTGRLRRADFDLLTRGVHLPRPRPALREELRAWALVLPPTAAFTHLTAAAAYGWRLPAPIQHPVFAAMREKDPRPRRPGLLVCRHPEPFGQRRMDGLALTTPAETLLAAARDLGVLDLVILGDSALALQHCTNAELWAAARQRRRGAPLLRTVIPLLDKRSESAWESILRILHLAAEIPVDPQYEIFDEFGRFVARADLRIADTKRIHEYDGAVHREAEVHARDLSREQALVLNGWERMGYTSRHIRDEGARIIASVDSLLGRPWAPHRLLAWNALLDESLLGRAGRARAYRRWGRALPAPGRTGQLGRSNGSRSSPD